MPFNSKVETNISTTPDKVWDAFTKPEQVKQWFFGTDMETTWEVGTPIYFRGEWDGKKYEDKGTVLEYVDGKNLSYNYWSSFSALPDSPENYQIIKYFIEPIEGGTKLTIEQENSPTQESADHSKKNWESMLDSIKKFLNA